MTEMIMRIMVMMIKTITVMIMMLRMTMIKIVSMMMMMIKRSGGCLRCDGEDQKLDIMRYIKHTHTHACVNTHTRTHEGGTLTTMRR